MSDQHFTLLTTGKTVSGMDPVQVQQNLRAHLKLPEMHISAMFSGKRTVIKKDVDLATAQKYIKQFYTMGLIVDKEVVGFTLETMSAPQDDISPPQEPLATDSNELFPQEFEFTFKGQGSEYFKIWIVNIVLTIVTLGIYSAWAKVRNKQYFYGNTFLDGSSFEYTATPIQILKGRMVAGFLLLIYFIGDALLSSAPTQKLIFNGFFTLLFIIVFPLLIIKGLQFNARYSTYRNVPFDFTGTYGSAFKYFILLPIASFTVVLLPYIWQRKNKFFVDNSAYGTESFQFSAEPRHYYRLLGILVVIVVGLALFAWAIMSSAAGASSVFVLPIFYLVGVLFVKAYFKVYMHNVMYNNTTIKEHSLAGNYEFSSYAKLLFINTVGILITLGLFIPWAKVRTAHYHAEHTQFIAMDDLNTFTAEQGERVNSLAEGLADANDIFDTGLGI